MQSLGDSVMYFTTAAARVRCDGRQMEFSGAGHPPAFLLRQGCEPKFLESGSAILGCFADAISLDSTITVPLQAGDRVMLYTDGFTETFNADREMIGIKGLAEIARQASALPLPAMRQQILDRVAAWRYGPAADDMSLVLLEVS
jgi:serine phosphatase RsbU (regulator of sigma subunit)